MFVLLLTGRRNVFIIKQNVTLTRCPSGHARFGVTPVNCPASEFVTALSLRYLSFRKDSLTMQVFEFFMPSNVCIWASSVFSMLLWCRGTHIYQLSNLKFDSVQPKAYTDHFQLEHTTGWCSKTKHCSSSFNLITHRTSFNEQQLFIPLCQFCLHENSAEHFSSVKTHHWLPGWALSATLDSSTLRDTLNW